MRIQIEFLTKNEMIDDFKNTNAISFNSSATVEALLSGINVINLSKPTLLFCSK